MNRMIRSERYLWPDVVRGIAVLSMLGYHFAYDWVFIVGKPLAWFTGPVGFFWQQSIGLTFTLVSGLSYALGKPKLAHGLRILLVALMVTLVTTQLMPAQSTFFGVLHMLGISLIIIRLIDPWIRKIPPGFGLLAALVLYTGFWPIGENALIGSLLAPSQCLGWFQNPLGWPQPSFFSADYYPLAPWFFAVVGGFFVGRLVGFEKKVGSVRKASLLVLVWLGQHALLIYLAHQPVLLVFLSALME